jgi:hypothetical protein
MSCNALLQKYNRFFQQKAMPAFGAKLNVFEAKTVKGGIKHLWQKSCKNL